MANEVIELKQEKAVDLAVNLTDRSIQAMSEQRNMLRQFVASQLKQGLDGDYAKIPGTQKMTLLKPGAEKMANIFQLGSRIVTVEREIDQASRFAMFTYTIEVFHIPTGKVIAQCQGSANTLEKKQGNKDFGFLLNSLGKIAQKRAFVGAVISATGASDFFTQDMEDAAPGNHAAPTTVRASVPRATSATSQEQGPHVCCGRPMMVSKYNENELYCTTCKAKKARA